jgi:hypothetical protein
MKYPARVLLSLWFTGCAAPAAVPPAPNPPVDVGQADAGEAEVAAAEPTDGAAADAEAADITSKPWPKGLYGKKPDAPVSLPAFTEVVDSTGASVSPDDLKGHWSVLWFYPMASTGG